MKRIIAAVGVILLVGVIGACSLLWPQRPITYTAPKCPPVSVSSQVVHSAQGDGAMVFIYARTGVVTSSYADVVQYNLVNPTKPEVYNQMNINDYTPAFYLVQQPHVLRYRVTNTCGSYQESIRPVFW